jgi:hypothetical protein
MGVKIQLLRGSAVSWSGSNPVLGAGQPGFESDTNKLKIGDGSTAWNSLSYFGGGSSYSDETVQDLLGNSFLIAGTGIALSYNDAGNTLTISTTGLQPSGSYASSSHTHTASNITDFNSSVSGLLPVKNIIGSGNIIVSGVSGTFTISSSGLVKSDVSGITGATTITNIVQISQTGYDNISVPNSNTLYIING